MQTLFGIKVTDRVQVTYDPAQGVYKATFDGYDTGAAERSGAAAVHAALAWFQNRKAEEEEAEHRRVADMAQDQYNEDESFLYDLSNRLGIDKDDLDTFIEIVRRRSEADAS